MVCHSIQSSAINPLFPKDDLLSVIRDISFRYDVHFTYDREIVENVKIDDYSPEAYDNVDDALAKVLSKTKLKYVMLEMKYVIIYRDDAAGMESLQQMVKVLQTIIDEKNTVNSSLSIDYLPGNHLLANTQLEKHRMVLNIKGHVKDSSGEPLIGVNVLVKGTNQGTATDFNGDFELKDVNENATLVFSYIGYESQELMLNGRSNINITLIEDSQTLDEVVVVGYGEQSRRKMSTAVSRISSDEINSIPVTNPGSALVGLASGVHVQSATGGTPGDAPIIRVRGIGSLGAANDPLYVVDGFPLSNAQQFNQISVSDIESIEVLKDAASAAIYGARAANGVILVTTKRGKQGRMDFNVDAYTGVQSVAQRMEVMNKEEYLQYVKDARSAVNLGYPDIYDTPDQLATTDWQDEIFRTAPMSKVEMSARGGNEIVQFALSGSYLDQQGTMKGTDYQLFSFRTNLDVQLREGLKVGANIAPSFSVKGNQPTPRSPGDWQYSPIYTALLLPPVVDARLENGDYGQNNVAPHTQYGFSESNIYNPLAVLDLYDNEDRVFGMQNNLFVEWQIFDDLKFKSQGGVVVGSNTNSTYIPSTLATKTSPFANLSNPRLEGIKSSLSNYKSTDWIWENFVTYNKEFGNNHKLSVVVLHSMQKFNSVIATTVGRPGSFTNDLVENPTASSNRDGQLTYGVNSFLSNAARVSYDYKDKYLFTGSIRRDGSSKFGPNERFGVFQSYSVGWRISEEPFMKSQNVFDELKLRMSYGETGNANIGDFRWLSGVYTQNYNYGDERVIGVAQSGFSNRDLTWEKSSQVDLGLEAAFFNERMYFILDFYEKNTKGMIFSKDLPGIVGYATSITTNVGNVRNRGFEINLTSDNLVNELKWKTNFNISYNESKVTDLGGRDELNFFSGTPGKNFVYKIEVGEPLGNMYGMIIDGVFKSEEELESYPSWPGTGVGDYKVRDVNGDGKIDEGDRSKLGNGIPKFIYGMTNTFSYGQFDLSFTLQGTIGNQILNGASHHTMLWAGRFNAVKDMADNYFVPSDPDKDVKYARVGFRSGFRGLTEAHNYAIHEGSYLRVSNLSLRYTIPSDMIGSNSAQIFFTAQNVLTFSKYPGYNVEPSQYGSSAYQPGSGQAGYPDNRAFLIGFNVGL
ncbi:TonB-dependent receptor [Membranihabitans marinus]